MTAPIVHSPGGGEWAEVGPVRFAIKAGSEETNGQYSLIEASGPVSATAHIHHDREEAFFVIDGSITFLAGEDRVEAGPGHFLLVPRRTMHGFRTNGESRLIIIHSPGGFEGFFRELGAAIQNGTFDKTFRSHLEDTYGIKYHDEITI